MSAQDDMISSNVIDEGFLGIDQSAAVHDGVSIFLFTFCVVVGVIIGLSCVPLCLWLGAKFEYKFAYPWDLKVDDTEIILDDMEKMSQDSVCGSDTDTVSSTKI